MCFIFRSRIHETNLKTASGHMVLVPFSQRLLHVHIFQAEKTSLHRLRNPPRLYITLKIRIEMQNLVG
jgi:hypothetical protein